MREAKFHTIQNTSQNYNCAELRGAKFTDISEQCTAYIFRASCQRLQNFPNSHYKEVLTVTNRIVRYYATTDTNNTNWEFVVQVFVPTVWCFLLRWSWRLHATRVADLACYSQVTFAIYICVLSFSCGFVNMYTKSSPVVT